MSPEGQRVAIAEACGWRNKDLGEWGQWWECGNQSISFLNLPEYLNDLNAMHEAVAHQCENQGFEFQQAYIRNLRSVVTRRRRNLNEMQVDYWMTEADAAQRAEAFLKTLSKWDSTK